MLNYYVTYLVDGKQTKCRVYAEDEKDAAEVAGMGWRRLGSKVEILDVSVDKENYL